MIRAFLALPLPDDTVSAVTRMADRLDIGRVVPPENYHITLAYLGEQPEDKLEELHLRLEGIGTGPLTLTGQGVDLFGGDKPRVLFAAIDPDPALVALRDRVRRMVRMSGIDLRHEKFRPHVTLSRLPGRVDPAERTRLEAFIARNAGVRLPPFDVHELTLFQSTLRDDAPLYTPLASYPLTG